MDLQERANNILQRLQEIHTPKPPSNGAVPAIPKPKLPSVERIKEAISKDFEQTIGEPLKDEPSLPPAEVLPVDIALWEALAYDLALGHASEETIADGYGISPDSLVALKENIYFKKLVDNKKEEVKSLGSDAAFTVKFRMISNKATQQFMQRLTSPDTSDKDFHALFKTAVELAQLVPKEETEQPMPVIGASVTFNITGVPGLEALAAASATAPVPDAIDTEFTEVE